MVFDPFIYLLNPLDGAGKPFILFVFCTLHEWPQKEKHIDFESCRGIIGQFEMVKLLHSGVKVKLVSVSDLVLSCAVQCYFDQAFPCWAWITFQRLLYIGYYASDHKVPPEDYMTTWENQINRNSRGQNHQL